MNTNHEWLDILISVPHVRPQQRSRYQWFVYKCEVLNLSFPFVSFEKQLLPESSREVSGKWGLLNHTHSHSQPSGLQLLTRSTMKSKANIRNSKELRIACLGFRFCSGSGTKQLANPGKPLKVSLCVFKAKDQFARSAKTEC